MSCDVPSHLYSFSFAQKTDWPKLYSSGADIQAYLEDVSEKSGIIRLCQFHTEITGATYQNDEWVVSLTDASANNKEEKFDYIISGLGGLHSPAYPNVPGLEDFKGASFHTAKWDHNVDLTGKNVAIIGNAASAVQAVPEIDDKVASLTIFQRTPNWMMDRDNKKYSGRALKLMRLIPIIPLLKRLRIFLWAEFVLHPAFRENSFMQKLARMRAEAFLRREVKDPELLSKLIPDYSVGCKRVLFIDSYLQSLQKDHVQLVNLAVKAVTKNGITDADDKSRSFDVIIYATGFNPFNILSSMEVKGIGGTTLSESWRENIRSHKTVAVSGFPNFFMLLGPNSALGHNSVILMIEAQVSYIVKCLKKMRKNGWTSLDPKPTSQEKFNSFIQGQLKGTVWQGSCSSWYKDSDGQNFTIWPMSATRYMLNMRKPDFSEYNIK
ncbi:MAG: 4-hydroxyacetophenone monooxygenase [Rhodobiaceae bacterium]|nr:4-hydroxyacetophenone monooxygenase [Rhodobiaceae bacterium]